jgi:hypothetical protein
MFLGFSLVVERGLLFGWEYYPALEQDDHEELNVYLILICIHIKWGYGEEV